MKIAPDNHPFRSHLETVAIFPFRTAEFEARYNIQLRKYWEDGLGHAMGRVIRLDSGRHFMFKELLDAKVSRLFAEADRNDCTDEGLVELLSDMALKEEDCVWTLNNPECIRNFGSEVSLPEPPTNEAHKP